MPMVVWGELTKSATDPTKIEEEIDKRIADHNADPDAHGLAGMALYAHRTGDVLDHIEKSIKATHQKVAAQVFECVVAPTDGDYTSIKAAIDAGKKRIYVKAGTYEITETILITASDVLIQGEGEGVTILKLANGANCNVIQIGDGTKYVSNVSLRHLQIDGNKDNQTTGGHGINLYSAPGNNVTDILIEHCVITRCYLSGINLTSYTGGIVIRRNIIWLNRGDGISGESTNWNKILHNAFSENSNRAIYLKWVGMSNIIGNFFTNSSTGLNHIYLDGCEGINIGNNFFFSQYSPQTEYFNLVYLLSSERVNLYGNIATTYDTPYTRGFYLKSSHSNIIVGNLLWRVCNGSIILEDSDNNLINGNQADSSDGGSGIFLTNSDRTSIIGNYCRENRNYGINISDATCDKTLVIANYLLGNTGGALNDAGTDTEIGHNITITA